MTNAAVSSADTAGGRNTVTNPNLNALMDAVNALVRRADFGPTLANHIFGLANLLKAQGAQLETTHQKELNAVFASLRQACCRDAGQMGTACRLKIMELVELRAMGWRSSLAHSNYYAQRAAQAAPPIQVGMEVGYPVGDATSSIASRPPLLATAASPPSALLPPSAAPNAFYFIPTPGGWITPTSTSAVAAPTPQPVFFSPSATPFTPMGRHHHHRDYYPEAFPSARQPLLAPSVLPPPLPLIPSSASSKSPQIRREMTIRNSDSGKIMGVKGRRVAQVEQLSHTIISFQKVEPKSRDRTLTITASTERAVEHARRLVLLTIRRNESPTRLAPSLLTAVAEGDFLPELQQSDDALLDDIDRVEDEDEDEALDELADLEDDASQKISIETGQDGVLRLHCTDPHLLQAAESALASLLRSQHQRLMSAEERAEKKRRRRSMPIQPSANSLATAGITATALRSSSPPPQILGRTAFEAPRRATAIIKDGSAAAAATATAVAAAAATAPASGPLVYSRSEMLRLRDADEVRELGDRLALLVPDIRVDSGGVKSDSENNKQ